MELKAFAKINLSIDVLGKRGDGYHFVKMIMQSVDLCDTLRFERADEGIKIHCSSRYVPNDRRNTVYKVLELIKEQYSVPWGISVSIKKNIPVAAGLAGGSSDAAQAIVAANKIWGLDMTYDDMVNIGAKVGADIPFCITGGTALAQGIGEKITKLPDFQCGAIVLAKPPVMVSTKNVYGSLKMDDIVLRPDTDGLIRAIEKSDLRYVAHNMVNVLETVTIKEHPIINDIKKTMLDFGALGSLMSGSGPTVFGLFEDRSCAQKCCSALKKNIKDVYLTRTLSAVKIK